MQMTDIEKHWRAFAKASECDVFDADLKMAYAAGAAGALKAAHDLMHKFSMQIQTFADDIADAKRTN
jgi:hypothetical protein